MSGESCDDLKTEIRVPFPTPRLAEIAVAVLSVDPEPRNIVSKTLSADGNLLIAIFSTREPAKLRVAVNGFFSNLQLVTETLQAFGPPASATYTHR